MCGIVAAVAQRDVVPLLIAGLKALEYRGYDSAGISVLEDGRLARVRAINLFGLSFVTLTFDDSTELLTARAQTLERLRLAKLPEGVQAELGSMSTPIGEIYRGVLPFLLADLVRLALVLLAPSVTLWALRFVR